MPALWCRLFSGCDCVWHIVHLFEGFTNHMNVANVSENDLAVWIGGVRAAVLVTTTLQFVGSCIKQRSGIVDLDEASLIVCSAITHANLAQKFLIASIPRAKQECAGLTATPYRSTCHFVVVAQSWQAIRRAKFRTFFNSCLVNLGWEYQSCRVGRAQIVSWVVKKLEESFSLFRNLTGASIGDLIEIATLSLKFFQWAWIEAPSFLVQLKQFNCSRERTLLKDILLSLRSH